LGRQVERNESFEHLHERCAQLLATLQQWLEPAPGQIPWMECFTQSVQLHVTPLSIAEAFRQVVTQSPKAWVFVSATLAVKNDFSHFQNQMGLESAATLFSESPFNYPEQALLYVPQGLPEPNTPDYTAAVMEKAWPVVEAAGGRTFLLFTSHRALQEGAQWVRRTLERKGAGFTLLVQGEASRASLLDSFRQSGNGLLLGTQSFWEGVDVKGDALSLVVIDKLPFAPPDDPVLAARIEHLNRSGRNAFMEFQLPQAVITLKQGAGRLIRDEDDRGVLMICDPRLLGKSYGSRIWRSLPPMARTREEAVALEFFRKHSESVGRAEIPDVPPTPLPGAAAV
jgi:ATP-dependent DNA helicase DinG